MAKVSVNSVRTAGILGILLVSGCAALLPQPQDNSTVDETKASQPMVAGSPATQSDARAPLPQQAYTAEGEKIEYRAEPNPYTSSDSDVPQEARLAFQSASKLMAAEQYREARKAFKAMTRDFPTLSGPWVKLGEIADKRDNAPRAEAAYRKAIEVNPDNVNAYMALALHQRRQGDFDGARQTYVDALELWKDFPGAHLNLAILYDLYLNQPELAQPHYEAYDFLTKGNDPKVGNWLVEVRRRTGIETSFIDNPPPPPELPAESSEPVAADKGAENGQTDKG
ncbi:tetratricopeptide repeat protein [uncultured Marinobacter sp.]|uniref:tetratricopeptide repeat protein n=1 Tax=uncultured Marinobacter sp. TaxID=187379 RepID=UPI00260E12EC|nr:tetratricopeptide repeat protein [uncultured Marinobacter sp.]